MPFVGFVPASRTLFAPIVRDFGAMSGLVFLGSETLTELQRATAFSCTINHDPISALRLRTE
ncbi:hypothetical protein X769_20765 [Mesorhizobium sp. LSJC268A00]|nr:hypothetical protein X769_20765 [Mesorhizobium sp. LSJC268A00]